MTTQKKTNSPKTKAKKRVPLNKRKPKGKHRKWKANIKRIKQILGM